MLTQLDPPGQYADDRNLSARERCWQHQRPYFDTVGWVLHLAGSGDLAVFGCR
jgi:hypothetical protein